MKILIIDDNPEALDLGADDYLARIRALLRRESGYKKSSIEIDNLKVDLATHQVYSPQPHHHQL